MMRHDRNDDPKTLAKMERLERVMSIYRESAWAAEDEVERLRAEIRDRESERADLRDRVQKAEAQVARVEALVDGSLPIGWNSEMGAVVFTDPRTAQRVPLRDWLRGPS